MAMAAMLLTRCRKDDPFPAKNDRPINAISFRINGVAWAAEIGSYFNMSVDPGFHDGSLGMTTRKDSPVRGEPYLFTFGSDSSTSVGEYKVGKRLGVLHNWPTSDTTQKNANFRYDSHDKNTKTNGYMKLDTYDLDRGVFTGTFQFQMIKGKDTINVTEGKFDRHYYIEN